MNPAHLDYDVLADLAEGLLDSDHAASANAHLDDCADCRELSAELADVSRILAEEPVPPMPAELTARIDDAIRAAAMSAPRDAPEDTPKDTPGFPGDELARRRGPMHLRILTVAAASVVAIGGAAVVGKSLFDSALDSNDTKANSGARADNPKAARSSARPNLQGGPGSAGGAAEKAPVPGTYQVTSSGTDYRGDRLGTQVISRLKSPDQLRAADGAQQFSTQMSGCVTKVSGGLQPVLVDRAKYEGRPATIIALPGEGGTYRVVIVGPGCSAQDADLIKQTNIAR